MYVMSSPPIRTPYYNTDNTFVKHFLTKRFNVPFGYILLNTINRATKYAKAFTEVPTVIGKGTQLIIEDKFSYITKSAKSIKSITSDICVLVSPTNTVISQIRCKYLFIVGGKSITIKNGSIDNLVVYGTEKITITDTEINDHTFAIVDTFELHGEFYSCKDNYISCLNFSPNNTRVDKYDRFIIGVHDIDLNKLPTKIIEEYPNMYILSNDYCKYISDFKIVPNIIHTRFLWFIWALWNVDSMSLNIPYNHLLMLESENINDAPNYLRMARYFHERNLYYAEYMYFVTAKTQNENVDYLSTSRGCVTTLDLIPTIFKQTATVKPAKCKIKLKFN